MLISFNPTVQNNRITARKQNTTFGDYFSAQKTLDKLIYDLASKNPAKKITEEQGLTRLQAAYDIEDKVGKQTLQSYLDQLKKKLGK